MKSLIIAGSMLFAVAGAASAGAATPTAPAQTNQPAQQAVPAASNNLRQQVQSNLAKAGFTDIKVMPESFMVRAKDQQGNPVMMVINPDSFTEVTTFGPKGSNTGSKGNNAANNAANPANAANAAAANNASSNGTVKQ